MVSGCHVTFSLAQPLGFFWSSFSCPSSLLHSLCPILRFKIQGWSESLTVSPDTVYYPPLLYYLQTLFSRRTLTWGLTPGSQTGPVRYSLPSSWCQRFLHAGCSLIEPHPWCKRCSFWYQKPKFIYLFMIWFNYFRERAHVSESVVCATSGGGVEEEKLKQTSHCLQSLTQGMIPWPQDHNLSQSQESDAL